MRIKDGVKGIKKFMNEKVKICTNILSDAQNRLVLGIIITGLGGGLIASAFVKAPQY